MEPAERVFAREFNASRWVMDDGGDRNGPYVVTPGGAWCRRVFIVGALTERRGRGGDVMHARVADPTGAFAVDIDRQHPDVAATLEYIEPPEFVAVTGGASLSTAGARARASVVPEALNVVDRAIRDIWVLRTAERTLQRIEALQAFLQGSPRGGRIEATIGHYRTTDADLRDLAAMVRAAVESVRPGGGVGEVRPVDGREIVLAVIEEHGGARGIPLDTLVARGVKAGLSAPAAARAVEELLAAGECYTPSTGMIKRI